jgi:hypothetical protein
MKLGTIPSWFGALEKSQNMRRRNGRSMESVKYDREWHNDSSRNPLVAPYSQG